MTHKNDPDILGSLLFNFFYQIRQFVFRMPDLVLQSIWGLFPPFHRFDLSIVHFETRQTSSVDLKFNIAIRCCVVTQQTVQMCQESAVVFHETRISGDKVDEVGSGRGLLSRLRGCAEMYL